MAAARRNGFLRGLGGMFSFVDVLNRRLLAGSAAEADAEAIHGYWEAVGGYLSGAMNEYAWEIGTRANDDGDKECQQTQNQKTPSPE